MGWCFRSRRADPFDSGGSEGIQKKCPSSSLRHTPESVPATQVTTLSTQEMEVMLGKAAAAHAEDDWAGGGKRQVSSLDGHVSVVMDQRPEEHEKFAALAKAHQEQEQLVQALQGQVTLLAAKMESMQHQRQDLQSTPTSFAPRPGYLSSTQEALDESHAHELPEASLDTGLPEQPGAAGVAGWGRSNAGKESMPAALTQRITALDSASQRSSAIEDGLAGLEKLHTREDGMGLVPQAEVAHALRNMQVCLQKFESALESALEGARQASQHAEKTSSNVQELQLIVRQTDKKVEELSKGLVQVTNKLHDRLVKLDAAQQRLAGRLSAVEEKAADKSMSSSLPFVSVDERRKLLKFLSDRDKEQARRESGHSEALRLSWPNGPQKQAFLARNSSAAGNWRQADHNLEGGMRRSEEQFRAVLKRRSQTGDVAADSGKLPDEILDSFGSSVVLQQPPSSMGSNRPSHAAIPKRKGISTESVVVQPAPTLKGTQHASIEDHHHDHQHDHSHLKKAEQEQILFTKRGSTFSRPTEITTTPALAAFAAAGNKGRSSGRFKDPKLAMPYPMRASHEGDSARMRKLD